MSNLSRNRQIQSVTRKAFTHRLPVTLLVIGLFLSLFNGWFVLGAVGLYVASAIALTLNRRWVEKVVRQDRGW